MRISTALNHRRRLLEALDTAYWWARAQGWTHARLMEFKRDKVYGDDAWKRVPAWVRRDVSTVDGERLRGLYRPDIHAVDFERMLADARAGREVKPAQYLRFAHFVDGSEVTTDELIRAQRTRGFTGEGMRSGFVWNHRPDGPLFGEGRK